MKRLLVIFIMLCCLTAPLAPISESDPEREVISWLKGSRLTPGILQLAIEFNGIKFPDIVFAQACLETGNFTSQLYLMHNNLFGMKKARTRQTTAIGSTDFDYAIYDSWYDSVRDMKLFQEYYLSGGRNLTDYFGFLASIGYAEDPKYIPKVKQLCSISK